MAMVARWLVVAVAAGCASVPPSPQDRQLLDVDSTTGRVLTTANAPIQFSIQFADRGARMPQSIVLDGVNRVASGSCPTEAGIGIGLFPAANVSAPGLGGDDATSSLDVEWSGPTLARISIGWALQYECVTVQQQAHGTSTFTIFPNGRIVRHDVATPSTTTLTVDGHPCGCGAETNFFFTSYWSFSSALVHSFSAGGAVAESGPSIGRRIRSGRQGASIPTRPRRSVLKSAPKRPKRRTAPGKSSPMAR